MLKSYRLFIAGRGLVGLSQARLAAEAGVALSVVTAIEQGRSDPKLSTVLALMDVLRAKGVEFIPETDRVAWGVQALRNTPASRLDEKPVKKRRLLPKDSTLHLPLTERSKTRNLCVPL